MKTTIVSLCVPSQTADFVILLNKEKEDGQTGKVGIYFKLEDPRSHMCALYMH